MKKVDTFKACISLQHMLDTIESEQKWLATEFTGLKGVHKKWFLSPFNSEVVSLGVGVCCCLAFLAMDVLTGMTHTNDLQLVSLTTMMPGALLVYSQNLRRKQIMGANEQFSDSFPNTCEIPVLDAFMHFFAQHNPDIATGFINKIDQLKSNGLTSYQAYRIVHILKTQFGITHERVLSETLVSTPTVLLTQTVFDGEQSHYRASHSLKL